jgi:hypothetical protein
MLGTGGVCTALIECVHLTDDISLGLLAITATVYFLVAVIKLVVYLLQRQRAVTARVARTTVFTAVALAVTEVVEPFLQSSEPLIATIPRRPTVG